MPRMTKTASLVLILLLSFSSLLAQKKYQYSIQIDPADVTIVRDSFGVPHVYGKTDADAAYGLGWCNAEDAFHLMQELLMPGTGKNGRISGEAGAAIDFFRHGIGARELVEERFDSEVPEDFKKYLEGYCQGVNAYAAEHPEEVKLKAAFPIDPKDVLTSFVVSQTFLSGGSGPVGEIVKGKYDKQKMALGSNAFALNSSRTEDGQTYLCINPHFQVSGPLTFYEAHISSEEGLNMHGALFHGASSIFMGNNEYCGWGMTWNYFDQGDVYKLKMHPKKKLLYEFDGEWKKLEKRPIWLKVKVKGIVIPVKKMSYWSVYGPTFKSPDKEFYSVRYAAAMSIRTAEQLYRMNKSTNLEEYKSALRLHGLAKFNIVYADRDDNLFYITYGRIPKREDTTYNWEGLLPGNTSKTLWTEVHEVDDHPQVENPSCGYIFNANNTPFHATCEGENDDPNRLPAYVDTRGGENNRSTRLVELLDGTGTFDFEKFKAVKFDLTFPKTSKFLKSVQGVFELDEKKYPDIADMIQSIKGWDRTADLESHEATLFSLILYPIFKKQGCGDGCFITGVSEVKEAEWVETIRTAKKHLITHFGSAKVPLRDFQRMQKGSVEVPGPGFPDVLSAGYSSPWKDGKYKLDYGDTYTHFVSFSKEGPQQMETLVPFGSSFKEGEKHFSDQAILAEKQQTKSATLNKAEVMQKAERVYHPGE